jgi:hypothetical protein
LFADVSRETQERIRKSIETVDNFDAAKSLLEPHGMVVVRSDIEAFRSLAQAKIWPGLKKEHADLWDEIDN